MKYSALMFELLCLRILSNLYFIVCMIFLKIPINSSVNNIHYEAL